jgi:hypothetical protein
VGVIFNFRILYVAVITKLLIQVHYLLRLDGVLYSSFLKQWAYTVLIHAFLYQVYDELVGCPAFCFLQILTNFSWVSTVMYDRAEHSDIDVTSGFYVLFGSGKNLFIITEFDLCYSSWIPLS